MDVVIGGGGFIGRSVVKALLAMGRDVRVFDRVPADPHWGLEGVEWHSGDFADREQVGRAVAGATRVFHFASTTVPKSSDENPSFDIQSNVVGSIHLIEACLSAGVGRIVYLSSGGTVYGIPRYVPIDEQHPTNPVVSYGIHKLAVEKYLELYRRLRGLDYRILRVANPYGPRQRPVGSQGVVAAFVFKAVNDQPIEIWGDGTVTRDYIYIDDVVDAIIRAADYDGEQRVFNIGSGKGVDILTLIDLIERSMGRKLRCDFRTGRPFDIPVNVLDVQKAREELGWVPKTDFSAGLELTRQWFSTKQD